MEFSDKTHIYDEFLEIMKKFKGGFINTPGVIERVRTLFRGYNKLILGFNTFLPEGEGYKIELTPEEEAQAYPGHGPGGTGSVATAASSSSSAANTAGAAPAAPAGGAGAAPAAGGAKPVQQMQQQHAISYVTTIRNRFANEPDTYRAFLKILHTYQKEQKGIKDVLEQVSLLFADHPDLLMEFTYFLPDAVQDQAKERLNRAARESEMRRRMMQAQQQQHAAMMSGSNKRNAAGNRKNQQYLQQQQQMLHAQHQQQLAQQHQRKNLRRRQGEMEMGRREQQMNHMSVTAERRFFDSVKDLLMSTSRDGWTEFVKHLDLFVADAITKKDLLTFAQDIFGAAGVEQFAELKKLMNARSDYEGNGSDALYAIPTSEIDFNQCRKCTPSYRALPKDYPKPVCSERSDMEQSVLNDEWITFPFSSEETYSFKHMAKNVYEEELFKCEEDRFEVDMIIDSNYCTIRILEPIAEEISNIKALEESGEANGSTPRFSLQLEKRNLSTVHLNSISRVYGEHGPEILELLHKNPAGTVPVVLKRLKQKDTEWRKARHDLNARWKEVVERNYEKSFDHRSYYHRRQDKRNYEVKALVADIKGESDSSGLDVNNGDIPCVSVLPPPELGPKLRGMNPQINLTFDTKHHSVHKDIYELLCHAQEAMGMANSDKERISFLWRDLLRVFLNLPVHYLYGPKAATSGTPPSKKTEEGGDSMAIEGQLAAAKPLVSADTVPVDEAEAWVVGTRVLTIYGPGVVLTFRSTDSIYSIGLPFGTAFVAASSIIGAEELSESALNAVGVDKEGVFGKPLPALATFTGDSTTTVDVAAAPAAAPAPAKRGSSRGSVAATDTSAAGPANGAPKSAHVICNEPDKLLYSTNLGYLFIRMYHCIYARLAAARDMSDALVEKRAGVISSGLGSGTGTLHGKSEDGIKHPLSYMDSKDDEATMVSGGGKAIAPYSTWFSQLLGLMDQSIDSPRYEDHCRQLLGNNSFQLFTMDKLVQQCLKTLQMMANEEGFNKLVGLFVYHRSSSQSFKVATSLSAHSGNCDFINSMEGLNLPPVAAAAPAAPTGRKSSKAAAPASGGATVVENISRVQRAMTTLGVDPLAYALHCGRLQESLGSHEDIYRLQHFPSAATDGAVGQGNSVIVCQLVGSLQSQEAQLAMAKGYDASAVKAPAAVTATAAEAAVEGSSQSMDVA
jgi:paired amphipathic helix protein Sin3a